MAAIYEGAQITISANAAPNGDYDLFKWQEALKYLHSTTATWQGRFQPPNFSSGFRNLS